VPTLHESEPVNSGGPMVNRDLKVSPETAKAFIEELM
jgi:hypothetical protein